ncbi:MAG: hypothetical protein EBQ96_04730 [Proteobacteria bacterium]|nr:hypothetical protein [Pseudomonadota bacterium]
MINKYRQQRGNVLFLILIAVALFAALSYAVTQSSRSGGDASKETNVINTASLTQYPNSVRTSVLRLIIGGIAPEDIYFNKPDEFSGAGFTYFVSRETRGTFHPQGGAAAYQQVPANLTASATALDWKFSLDFEIPLLGLSGSGYTGNDLIMFADGVSQSVCDRVNKELHQYSGATPIRNTAATLVNERTATTAAPAAPGDVVLGVDTPSTTWLDNKAFGCFQNGTSGNYVFFYVMAER